ncbi:hypothetical protein ACFXD5_23740 [Streptomyces sp. NPDC059385]|uniref:hypothetical protein n=1 Tax=Streptomyces sp. NPDC059385 TaxID=3346817 RepID=UPI00367B8CF7
MERITWTAGGRSITVSLPAMDAEWAVEGVRGLWAVRATHEGRGPEPRPLPEAPETNPAVIGGMSGSW